MNTLVTGGFGNIGVCVVNECLLRGHVVSVFEVRNRRTERLAREYGRKGVRVRFGDLRREVDVAQEAAGQGAVLHPGAILPPVSEAHPDLCHAVNVGGTSNRVRVLQGRSDSPVLVAVSSAGRLRPS